MTQPNSGPLEPAAANPHKPADDHEEIYYKGSPQIRAEVFTMLGYWIAFLVLVALGVTAFIMKWPWIFGVVALVLAGAVVIWPILVAKTTDYRISNYRIDYERGILSKKIDTLELWHVDDIDFHQSLLERIMGVATITVHSGDETTPHLKLYGIPNPRPVFDALKQRIISVKRQRGVIKMDVG